MNRIMLAFSNVVYKHAVINLMNKNNHIYSVSCSTEIKPKILETNTIIFTDTGFTIPKSVSYNEDLNLSWFILLDFARQYDPDFAAKHPRSIVSLQSTEHDLKYAVDAALRKSTFYASDVISIVEKQKFTSLLNDRERDILMLIAQGKQSKEIAHQLFLSPHTINTHRKNLLKKLDARTPTELLINAIKHGLIAI